VVPEEGVEPLLAATDPNRSQPTPIEKADPTGLLKPLPLERSASSEAESGEVRGRFWTAMLTAPAPRLFRPRCEAVEELTNSGSPGPLNFGRSPVGPERDEEKL